MPRTHAALSFVLLASSLAAQQFAEVGKAYMPKERPWAWSVATADVDGDGDLDLAFGST